MTSARIQAWHLIHASRDVGALKPRQASWALKQIDRSLAFAEAVAALGDLLPAETQWSYWSNDSYKLVARFVQEQWPGGTRKDE